MIREKIIEELDLLIRMDIPKESFTDYPADGRNDVESFPITYSRYNDHAVSNRMVDLRKQWALLKPMIV